jgi:hypothetical protein
VGGGVGFSVIFAPFDFKVNTLLSNAMSGECRIDRGAASHGNNLATPLVYCVEARED